MKGNITHMMFDFAKKKTIVQVEFEGNVQDKLEGFKDKALDIVFKIFRQKRSLNSNAYAWVLINKLAEEVNESDIEIYRQYIKAMGVYRDVDIDEKAEGTLKTVWQAYGLGWLAERVDFAEKEGFVTLRLYYGSSVYNTKQMARFIDAIVQDCQAVGIDTMTPEEIAKMNSLWKAEGK